MSNSDFWDGEPKLAIAYRKSQDFINESKNQELWLQGVYNYRAFAAIMESFAYGLGGGKGNKPSKYPDRPFAITEESKKNELERNKQRTLAWVQAHQ